MGEGGVLQLGAPQGFKIDRVVFASYGTPINYSIDSNCHAADSLAIVERAIQNETLIISADNSIFGDPCNGTGKHLSVILAIQDLPPVVVDPIPATETPILNDPTNLSAVLDTTTQKVTLSWTAPTPSNTSPERYAIMWRTASTNGWGIATGNVGDSTALNTSITIDVNVVNQAGLDQTYLFQVRADNDTLGIYSNYTSPVEVLILDFDRLAAEQAAIDAQIAADKAAAEAAAAVLAAQQAEAARIAAEQEAARQAAIAAEQTRLAEIARLAAIKAEEERITAELAAQKAEADRLAAEEAARIQAEKDRLAEEAAAKAEADRLVAEAAAKKAEEERIAAELAAKIAEEERLAAEIAKAKAEEEARLAEEARLKAEAEAKAAEEARIKAEAEAKAAEEARLKAEEEARLAEEARLKAEAEAKSKAEEEAKRLAEQKAAEEAKVKAEADNVKAEAEAKKAEEEKLAKIAEEAKQGKELSKEEVAAVVTSLVADLKPGESISAAEVKASGVSYSDLPPETPVEVRVSESGEALVITAEVAANVELVTDAGALLEAAFTDPGAALAALGSIGADMTEGEREEATDMVVATVVAAGAAMNAVGAAAGSTGGSSSGNSSGGGSGGGGASGDSKGVRRRKP